MAVPKRKTSKMKMRSRKASNSYQGLQFATCLKCGTPKRSHFACPKPECGAYKH